MNDVVQVREYERADGTKVRAHSRWHPGARRELAIIASAMIFRMVPGMGDEIIAARRDSYDPASRQAAAIVTRPVSGIAQGITTHAGRDNASRAPATSQTSAPSVAHASSGIAAHSTRPTSSATVPPRPSVPPQDNRGSGT